MRLVEGKVLLIMLACLEGIETLGYPWLLLGTPLCFAPVLLLLLPGKASTCGIVAWPIFEMRHASETQSYSRS